MRERIIILLLTGCIFACTEKAVLFPENEAEEETYTTGYLQIFLDNPEVTTRSSWEEMGYDFYFPEADILSDDSKHERWLHNLSLVYFDSDLLLVNFYKQIDYRNDNDKASDIYAGKDPSTSNMEYSAFTLGIGELNMTTGAYYFYVLCNLPLEFLDSMEISCKNRFNELTKDEFEKTIANYTIQGITEYERAPGKNSEWVDKPRFMMTNITSPAPHYMADKNLIVGGGSYPDVNGITMSIGKSLAKVSVAYIPQTNNITGTLSDVQYRIVNDPKQMYMLPNIFNGQEHTPHYAYSENITDFDDYWDNYFNPESKISFDREVLIDEQELINSENNFKWRNASTPAAKTYAYCMENGNQTPLQGNSTMVLVKAKYIPAGWLNPDGTAGIESGDGTFWRIRTATGDYIPGYYNARPILTGTREAVEYPEGITYYPIWLETGGKYMVKRNHYYKIAITEVLSPGAPDIDSVMTLGDPLVYSKAGTKSNESGNILPGAATAIKWEQNN